MKAAILLALTLLTACSSREVIVVYSPHGADILKDYEKLFEAAYPEIDMQWLDMGSQHVYTRISSEHKRPACDIWWGGPSTMFMQASEDGLLEAYEPTWSAAIGDANRDPGHTWYGTHSTPLAIMFNTGTFTRDDVPHTWDELLDEKWKGRITIRKPLESGTMRTFIGAMVSRAPSEDEGIEWLKKLHASTENYVENPQLLFDRIKRNENFITVWIMPDAVLQRDRHGYPFDFYLPPDTPVLTEGIAIPKNAPHRAAAEKFYEFVTTQEALIHQAETYGKVPARSDIDVDALPEWIAAETVDPMDIDWATFSKKNKEWCARWDKEVYSAR